MYVTYPHMVQAKKKYWGGGVLVRREKRVERKCNDDDAETPTIGESR